MPTLTWNAAAGTWSDPSAWTEQAVPGAGDVALFDTSGSETVFGDGTAGEVRLPGDDSVTITGSIVLSGATDDVTPGGSPVGLLIDDPNALSNGLTIDSGATLDTGGAAVEIGVTQSGLLLVQGVLDSGDAAVGVTGTGQSSVTISGNGAAWNAAGTVVLGNAQANQVAVSVEGDYVGGATLSAAVLHVANASLTVIGASPYAFGTALTVTYGMEVGSASSVLITDAVISTGSATIAGSVQLGPNGTWDGAGIVTIDGGQLSVAPSSYFNVPEILVTGGGQMTLLGPSASAGSVDIVLQGGTFDATGYYYAPLSVNNAFTLGAGTDVIAINAGGTMELYGAVSDGASSGQLTIGGGFVELDSANSYSGGTVLQAGTLALGVAGAAGSGGIAFAAGGNATLQIDAGAMPTQQITGFTVGDTIALAGSSLSIDSYDGSHLVFDLDGTATTLDLLGSFTAADFQVANSGGMELLTTEVPCFCRGTLIRTPNGDRPVESLEIGDLVTTLMRGAVPVRWIGKRSFDGRFINGNTRALPIRIEAGALGVNRPETPLHISPEHALFLDGLLVPAAALVNGNSIRQLETAETVEYFHIELDRHDILIANGAPAESFLDECSRGMFHNAHEYSGSYPGALPRPQAQPPCAPRVVQGPSLESIRAGLARLAAGGGIPAPFTVCGRLEGYLDQADHNGITGWARDVDDSSVPVQLEVLDRDEVIGVITANGMREDLLKAGIGTGRHSFDVRFATPLSALVSHVIRVRRVSDGQELMQSGVVLAPAAAGDPGFAEAVETALAGLVVTEAASACTPLALDRLLTQLAQHTDRLREARARLVIGGAPSADHRVVLPIRDAMPPRPMGPQGPWVLVIDERAPRAGHDGGANAVLSHCASLQRLGWNVALLVPAATEAKAAAALEALGIVVLSAPYYATPEEALRRHAGQFDLVYLHRLSSAVRYGGLVRHHNPQARILYAVADLHHLRLARQAAVLDRPDLMAESRAVQQAEFNAMRTADIVITHSGEEAGLIRRALPQLAVHVVPWAVAADAPRVPAATAHGVAFLAGYEHTPNLDAVGWLLREIMPLVWQSLPDLPCVLAGSDMPEALRRFDDTRVIALGEVAELDTVFQRVRLTVAPLRFGAGVKAKVLDSLAAGVPCVCTGVAAEGLDFRGALSALRGDTAAELAARIVSLHEDRDGLGRLSQAGQMLIWQNHSPAEVDRRLAEAIGPQHLPMGQQGRRAWA